MRSFASLYLFLRMFSFLWFRFMYETCVLFGVCCLVIALVRPYKKPYMNNIDVLILALLALNTFQLNNIISCSASFKSTHSEFHFWSMIATAYLPLLVISYNVLPCKCLFQLMKQKLSICKKLCCIFDEGLNVEAEVSDNDSHDPHRVVHPDQYSTGDTNGISEADTLLHEPERALRPVYLSIN